MAVRPVRPTVKRPGHTCPDIDAAIAHAREAWRIATRAQKVTEDPHAESAFGEIESEVDGLEDTLEKLRKANAALRENAEEWEAYALELEDDLEKAEQLAEQLERAAAGEF